MRVDDTIMVRCDGEVDLGRAAPDEQDIASCAHSGASDQSGCMQRRGRDGETATAGSVIGGKFQLDANRKQARDNQTHAIEPGRRVATLQAKGRPHQPLRCAGKRVRESHQLREG